MQASSPDRRAIAVGYAEARENWWVDQKRATGWWEAHDDRTSARGWLTRVPDAIRAALLIEGAFGGRIETLARQATSETLAVQFAVADAPADAASFTTPQPRLRLTRNIAVSANFAKIHNSITHTKQ